ncbi:MAG TPA: GtrA family protein [Bryobacteraceae bacterium]|jgi:putative flippase GtrA
MKLAAPEWRRFSRFVLIGLLGGALQVILFECLIRCAHLREATAAPIAVEAVILHNYFWHARITWRDRKIAGIWQRVGQLWRYHAGNGFVSIVGNTVLAYWFVQRFAWPAPASEVLAIAICAPVNFFVADRWVYAAVWENGSGD